MDPKHITRTSFCNKEVDNVTDNSMKKYILDNLKLKTNIKYDARYAKVYNEQFKKNLNNPHIFCLKSSGTPYLLFCTQINDINYSFLIDKKVKDGVYRFKCVLCSLSEPNPNKWKGYLSLKGNSYNYCCHRSNQRSSLKNFIKEHNPDLFQKYESETSEDVFPSHITFSPEHLRIISKGK